MEFTKLAIVSSIEVTVMGTHPDTTFQLPIDYFIDTCSFFSRIHDRYERNLRKCHRFHPTTFILDIVITVVLVVDVSARVRILLAVVVFWWC